MTNYVNPSDYEPGDTIDTDDLNDPLAVLLTWRYEVREKVANVLRPLCYFVGNPKSKDIPGDLRFYDAIEPAELRSKVFKLAYAAQYELGLRQDHRLTEAQAEALASEIAAQQNAQRTADDWRACGYCGRSDGSHDLSMHPDHRR